MNVIRGLRNLKRPARGSVVTIGVFDGVHKGHEAIIRKTVERAKALGLKSIVVTFDPHPLKVIHPSPFVPSLISLDHRLRLIEALGVDITVIVKFTRPVARLSPEDFVGGILAQGLGSREVYVGENFYFGKGASASAAALKRIARRFRIRVRTVAPVMAEGRVVSSSVIRGLITIGELRRAARFLGRPVSILGTVVRGSRRGRLIGYPTANIDPHHEAIPASGVYAARVIFRGRELKGIVNIGIRPTFIRKGASEAEPRIEVHIFGFSKKIYGEDLEIIFVRKLRDERPFASRAFLSAQIAEDGRKARRILR